MSFLLCSSCKRHVKSDASGCPFCAADMRTATTIGNAANIGARTRSRLLFGTVAGVVATSLASCGDSTSSAAFYGAPCSGAADCNVPIDSGASPGAFDASRDAASIADAGVVDASDADVDATDAADAADE